MFQITQVARHHSLERTSPKGPGLPFIGRCILCGAAGLRMGAAMEYCENPIGLTDDQAILEVINGPI